ncbi:hypothetical protein AVEN_161145-1 [Araneus ventricosus]|uniref:Uncharacterized protein n=1 Tax=Araneus ventricosus TaxID=182803 RepID=A0A4Y2LKK6_ARAVE|nr:hypothetical protein AVEN_161145-1 [Araneus ventricosus]
MSDYSNLSKRPPLLSGHSSQWPLLIGTEFLAHRHNVKKSPLTATRILLNGRVGLLFYLNEKHSIPLSFTYELVIKIKGADSDSDKEPADMGCVHQKLKLSVQQTF